MKNKAHRTLAPEGPENGMKMQLKKCGVFLATCAKN